MVKSRLTRARRGCGRTAALLRRDRERARACAAAGGAADSSARSARPTPEQLRRLVQLLPDHVPAATDGDGGGWQVDYPRADINLSIRLSELTKTRISRQTDGEPNHLVMQLTDPAIFKCPFIMMTEVGRAPTSGRPKPRTCASTC